MSKFCYYENDIIYFIKILVSDMPVFAKLKQNFKHKKKHDKRTVKNIHTHSKRERHIEI